MFTLDEYDCVLYYIKLIYDLDVEMIDSNLRTMLNMPIDHIFIKT